MALEECQEQFEGGGHGFGAHFGSGKARVIGQAASSLGLPTDPGLVRDLAQTLHTRIEMRQIGVRDEAKLLADYGDCGKPVCCNTHLNEMPPVSMKMAKIQKATLDPANTKYSWKLFSFKWDNATPGEHTIVSRATDVDGLVQPTAAELATKRTFLEDNGQFPRKVKIG